MTLTNTHKSGFVNIIGNPNVGKSTLMNFFVGEKLSIITHKAQTTRHRIVGIYNDDEHQIVFSDTPGIVEKPAYELQSFMMGFTQNIFEGTDVLIYMVEIGEKTLKNKQLYERLKKTNLPLLILINKVDTTSQEKLEDSFAYWTEEFPKSEVFPISAKEKFNTTKVLDRLKELLPLGPSYYDKKAFTDRPERFFVNEIVREKILLNYSKEVPYSVEVLTEEFLEEEKIIKIRVVIVTERDTQKGILLGHQGKSIKQVGRQARLDMERFFDKKVFLQIFVKVIKNWRNNKKLLNEFGYNN